MEEQMNRLPGRMKRVYPQKQTFLTFEVQVNTCSYRQTGERAARHAYGQVPLKADRAIPLKIPMPCSGLQVDPCRSSEFIMNL